MDEGFDPEAYAVDAQTGFDPEAYAKGDPYKQALIDKIQSGATDYTYGPGSPGATPADMRQKTGARDNALQTGDIALPPADYKLFSPQERAQLGIADTSFIKEGQPTPRGSVERYFGPEQAPFNPHAYAKGEIPNVPDIHAFVEAVPPEPPSVETPSETPSAPSVSAGTRPSPLIQVQVPSMPAVPIPTVAAPPAPLIGEQRPAIPSPLPTPTGLPALPSNIAAGLLDTLKGATLPFGTVEDPNVQYPQGGLPEALATMFPQQGQALQQAASDIAADPTSRAAFRGYGTIGMAVAPALGHVVGNVRETSPLVAEVNKGLTKGELPAAAQPVTGGDLWYQGVSKEGATQWVTHDPKIAAGYAKRRGEGAKVNVYTADQIGQTAFADQHGNPISPQEYAKYNWSTTIQTGGKPLPNPIRTLSIADAEGSTTPLLTRASRSDSQIRLSFDAKGGVPTPEELTQQFKKLGHNVGVTKFSTDLVSASKGEVNYRVDVFDQGNRLSSSMASKAMADAFGSDTRFSSPTQFEKAYPLQQRFAAAHEYGLREMVGAKPPSGEPPAPPSEPPQLPPPSGGGIPPQPPKNVAEVLRNRQIKDRIAAGYDSVFTRADYDARQKANPLRQEFGQRVTEGPKAKANIQAVKDREAATTIFEAQGNKIALKHDLDLVRTSKNEKLAKEMTPKYQYALDNFDRISNIKNSHVKLMQDQMAEDAASGIEYGEQQGYVTHVLRTDPKDSLISMFTKKMGSGGLTRYFTKNREFGTLAEAIHEGIRPASMDLADLDQHRIASSRRLILQKALFNELRNIVGKDGQPVVASVGRGGEVPFGYEPIRANGVDLAVHPDYAGIFKSLYGDSAMRRGPVGRAVMRTAGVMKAYTLAADTYHGFRGIQKGAFFGGKGSRFGYRKGTTVYELSNEALDTAVKNNEISRGQADWAKSARPAIEEMMANGLNVSRYADNLVGQLHVNFPGTRGLNDWIFNRVFRGSMIQASHANYLRNLSRWPELTKQQVARRTAKEMNEVFGNLMNQGLFKDKTVRDALNVAVLAPQWVESQARAEFRGYGQMGQMVMDAATKRKFRMGTVAQGQLTAVTAYLIGNQIINYATTGHSTFENDGAMHKLSAFLPVGQRGVYIDPLALSAEYVDRFMSLWDRQGDNASVPAVLSEMARSKLSRAGQAVVTLATQRDWAGHTLHGADLYKQAGADILPVPIASKAVSSTFSLDPNSPTGFSIDPEWDKITQSVLQSMGQRGVLGAPVGQYPRAPLRVREPHKTTRKPSRGVM